MNHFDRRLAVRPTQRAQEENARAAVSRSPDAPASPSTPGNGCGVCPLSNSIAGITNSSNVTIVETGFPGNPNTGLPWHKPKTAGLPGRIATASKKNSVPSSFSTCSTRSYFPTETPPVITTISASSACPNPSARAAPDCHARLPSITGSPPASATCAASEMLLLLRIWNWLRRLIDWDHFVAGRKDRYARLLGDHQPRSPHLRRHRELSVAEPLSALQHAFSHARLLPLQHVVMHLRAQAAQQSRNRPPLARAPCITTAFAPRGTGAPVMICTHVARLNHAIERPLPPGSRRSIAASRPHAPHRRHARQIRRESND